MQNIHTILGASFMSTLNEWTASARSLFSSLGAFGDILLVLIILWIGKFIVKGVGKLVEKSLSKTSLDDKIAAKLGHDTNVSKGIVGFVKALLMLLILLFALDAVEMTQVSSSINLIWAQVALFIPKLLLAGLLAYIVVMVAGLVKTLLTDVLKAAKVDERLGSVAGTTPITGAVATAAYAFFLLLFTPAILDILGVEAVSKPIQGIVNQITGSVDEIIVAGVIIFLGCLIANIAKRLVTNLLQATNVDSFPAKLGLDLPATGAGAISSIAGTVVSVSVIVLALTSAIKELDIEILSLASVGLYTGYFNILLALLILAAGILAARFAYDKLVEGNATLAKVAKYGIITLTTVVALSRTGLAPEITSLPYTVAIYALGVAFGIGGAIAIGLGANSYIQRWLEKRG